MDFNDMKKIWDEQNKQSLYAIDEQALHERVIKKKSKAAAVASRSEKAMIGSLIIASLIVWGATIYTGDLQLLPLVLSGFMITMAGLLYNKRIKRLKWQNTFDRSIAGDFDEAIANAEYQLQISKWSRNLFFVVAAATVYDVFSITEWWKSLITLGFFLVVYRLAKWEYKTFYLSQRNNLVGMKEKFAAMNADPSSDDDFSNII